MKTLIDYLLKKWHLRSPGANVLLQAGFWMTIATIAGGALGYFYQVLMGRLLLPADFALFNSVMALTVFFASPLTAMLLVLSRRVSALHANRDFQELSDLYMVSQRYLTALGVMVFIFFILTGDFFASRLNLPDPLPVWIFSLSLIFTSLAILNNAYFQGLKQFRRLGWMPVLAVFSKVVFSAVLIHVGFGVTGALTGALLATILAWLLGWRLLAPGLSTSKNKNRKVFEGFSAKSYSSVLLACVAFSAMTQLDMVVVNWFFAPADAGLYAAASVLGKAVLYIPGGVIMVMFPIVSETQHEGAPNRKFLVEALLITALLSAALATAYFFLADWLIDLLYGPLYFGAGDILRWYGFAILPMSLVMLAEHFLIAQGRVVFAWVFFILAPIQLFAFSIFHRELWMILTVMGFFGVIVALIGVYFVLQKKRPIKKYSLAR